MHVACKRDNSNFIRYVVTSPETEIVDPSLCANFDTLRHILVIFGKSEKEDQYRTQERQL